MRGRWAPAAALLLAGLVSACASDQGPPRGRGPGGGRGGRGGPPPGEQGGPGGPPGGGLRLFISPAGEPFRPYVGGPEPLRQWFDQADTNHDGMLTADEFLADHMRFFARLDTNNDGRIDSPEVDVYEEKIAPEILSLNDRPDSGAPGGARGGGPGGGGPGGGGGGRGRGGGMGGGGGGGAAPKGVDLDGAARFGLINEPEPIRAADSNLDFVISDTEWRQAAARRFAILDLNHDGKLAFDELRLLASGGRGGRGGAQPPAPPKP